MAIVREFCCLAHGAFESSEETPDCPYGCDTVERAFYTPPSVGSKRTQNIDRTLNSLAKSHNMTDIGPAAMRRKALAAEKSQEEYRSFCENRFGGLGWGNVPKGGTYDVQKGAIVGEGPGAISAVSSAGAVSDGTVSGVRDTFNGVKAIITHKDPQNLSLSDAKAA